MLAPFLSVSALQWRDSAQQVDNAHAVLESAERLDVLLRIPTALNNEVLVIGWEIVSTEVFELLPVATTFLNFETLGTPEEASRTSDELLAQIDEPALVELVVQAREQVGAESSIADVANAYDRAIQESQRLVDEELITLNAAALRTGDAQTTRSTRLAETISELQLNLSGMNGQWGSLVANDFFSPTAEMLLSFNHRLVEYQALSRQLQTSIPPDGPLRDRWTELDGSAELELMLTEFQAVADDAATNGIEEAEDGSIRDLTSLNFAEVLELNERIKKTFAAADTVDQLLANLLDATVSSLEDEANGTAQSAEDRQRSTIVWILLAAGLATSAILAGAFLIGRPVRRMATAAKRLSEGDLDVRVPERGPREVAVGSRALNSALASLRTAEAQAVALAEERLDDPVLNQQAPGNLGASLQTAVRRLATTIAERERIQTELAYEATHDGLTRLANRRAVIKHLHASIARAERGQHLVALLFVDLDDFKAINDAHGHHAGDILLQEIADRLQDSSRAGDLAGRLGGDEFVVVADPIADVDAAIRLAHRLRERLMEPLTINGTTIVPHTSIGIGLSNGSLTADEVLRDADIAVYRAKAEGKGQLFLCDEDLRREVDAHAAMEEAITHAIADGQFELYFQPTVHSRTGEVVLFEALVRWNHPELGLTSPNDFIPTAEKSDLIVDIDRWVLAAAAKQLEEWGASAHGFNQTVSVNVSGRHLGSGTLTDYVAEIIERFDFSPRQVVIEVTETALLGDIETAANELADLRELGVRIALDDFGTGFMSLANLRSLPVDLMKIDQSFVHDLNNPETRSLINLIIDTGHLLGIAVTAEGIETQDQFDEMRLLGADSLQGFFLSEPVRASELQLSPLLRTSRFAV